MGSKTFADEIFSGNHSPCYHNHPALVIGDFKIYGGGAHAPVVKDADLYVSLQSGSTSNLATAPWDSHYVQEFAYSIPDMGTPKNTVRFKQMISWLCNQLQAGKKIHIGCIGGHGRTGMVLSAIAAEMGIKDAIQYVRKNYCDRAVESREQVKWLMANYGVSEVKGAKEYTKAAPDYGSVMSQGSYTSYGGYPNKKSVSKVVSVKAEEAMEYGSHNKPLGTSRTITPVKSGRNIWKRKTAA